ncbi:MAG: sulfite exporter TauE/SafE family protein [Betaproteobacteria bacterium]
MLIDTVTMAWVGVVAFVAAVIGGLGGFGTGVILTAVLIPIVGVKAVLPLLTVAGVVINAGRMFFYRHAIDWRTFGTVLAAALRLALAGVYVFSVLPARPLQIILAVFIAAVIPLRRWAVHRAWRLRTRGVLVGGGVFGFLSGIVSGTGVFLISLLLATGLPGQAIVATDAAISMVNDAFRLALFGGYTLIDGNTFATGALIGVITIPGSYCAKWLSTRMSAHLHIAVIEGILLIASLWLIISAFRASV